MSIVRVFSQASRLEPEEFRIVQQARVWFQAELTFTKRRFLGSPEPTRGELLLLVQPPPLRESEEPSGLSRVPPPPANIPGHVPPSRDASESRITCVIRPVEPSDLADAEAAELKGRAGGMAQLARRCRYLWELRHESNEVRSSAQETSQARAMLILQGTLAGTELGPVLPGDMGTLYGIRGARERLALLSAS